MQIVFGRDVHCPHRYRHWHWHCPRHHHHHHTLVYADGFPYISGPTMQRQSHNGYKWWVAQAEPISTAPAVCLVLHVLFHPRFSRSPLPLKCIACFWARAVKWQEGEDTGWMEWCWQEEAFGLRGGDYRVHKYVRVINTFDLASFVMKMENKQTSW